MLDFQNFKELDKKIGLAIQQEAKNVYGQELPDPAVARMKKQLMDKFQGKVKPSDFEKEVAANEQLPDSVKNVAHIITSIKFLIKQAVAEWNKTPEEKETERQAAEKEKQKADLIRALKTLSAPKKR